MLLLIVHGSFKGTSYWSNYTAWNVWMAENNELGEAWKEAIVA